MGVGTSLQNLAAFQRIGSLENLPSWLSLVMIMPKIWLLYNRYYMYYIHIIVLSLRLLLYYYHQLIYYCHWYVQRKYRSFIKVGHSSWDIIVLPMDKIHENLSIFIFISVDLQEHGYYPWKILYSYSVESNVPVHLLFYHGSGTTVPFIGQRCPSAYLRHLIVSALLRHV